MFQNLSQNFSSDSLNGAPSDIAQLTQLQQLAADFNYQAWLQLQAKKMDGAYAALLAIKATDGRLQPSALWEQGDSDCDLLAEITERGLDQGQGLVVDLSPDIDGPQKNYAICYPVRVFAESSINSEIFAVVTIALRIENPEMLTAAMQQLQWGCAWLQASQLHSVRQIANSHQTRLGDSVSLLANVLAQANFDAAAMRLLSDLVSTLDCEMVSLGYRKKGSVEICHLSHSAQFGKQMNWVRAIEKAMDEAIDQQMTIAYSPKVIAVDNSLDENSSVDHTITVAHAALALQQQQENILTLPIYIKNNDGVIEAVGAVTLERDIEVPFKPGEIEYCESVLSLIGCALEDKRQNAKSLPIKILDTARLEVEKLSGPDFWGRKLLLSVAVLLMLFFVFASGEYRLSSSGKVEAKFQRVIATPFDGYIDKAPVRAGDLVKKGELIFSIDDRELQLERLRWLSQNTKLNRQYQEAMAEHDRAKINIIAAQLEQGQAELQLVESKIERADQMAPFDGLIVSGDLSQSLGGAVAKGEPLFELSPLGEYRVELLVKESRIADVQLQQSGKLHLSALPDHVFDIEVNKITPITVSQDGASFFSVEAKILNPDDQLRPGMEGIGKVYIDDRNLFGIWTRELSEWLRLLMWKWWA